MKGVMSVVRLATGHCILAIDLLQVVYQSRAAAHTVIEVRELRGGARFSTPQLNLGSAAAPGPGRGRDIAAQPRPQGSTSNPEKQPTDLE